MFLYIVKENYNKIYNLLNQTIKNIFNFYK